MLWHKTGVICYCSCLHFYESVGGQDFIWAFVFSTWLL